MRTGFVRYLVISRLLHKQYKQYKEVLLSCLAYISGCVVIVLQYEAFLQPFLPCIALYCQDS